MQPVTDARPTATPLPVGGGLGNAVRWSKSYFDERNIRRVADKSVPVDQYGKITAVEFVCPKCQRAEWVALAQVSRGIPVCPEDNRQMVRRDLKRAPVLPWRPMWRATDKKLRAVWVGAATAGAGELANTQHIPGAALAALAVPAGAAARRIAEARMLRLAAKRERIDPDEARSDKRIRATIARRARGVAYCTTTGCMWTALAAETGLDYNTFGGKVSWTALALAWAWPAMTWWKHVRDENNRPEPAPAPAPEKEPEDDVPDEPSIDPDEAEVRRRWSTIVAARKDQVIGRTAEGQLITAPRAGKLVETRLEDWHKVVGGWAATAVGPDGLYLGDDFMNARGAVASAFKMKTSMITCVPDADDENRALFLAQRTSPIADVVNWAGPQSIDAQRGVAPVAVYVDGHWVMYEIYRPGWGTPHVAAFGTTGSGKSEFLNQLFAIDRWAHYVDADGVPHGMVADFLIDPQQGQSFAPFADDLAAPIACSLAEAMMLVEALTDEMRRRNRYLRSAEWWDPKRKIMRKGRKWWNPLVDGPILALTIDEAHEYLSYRPFCNLVTSAGRMWRKCGGQVRIGTHTPLLQDLGGDMALRDMLTGGFVWVGRTANGLTSTTAFNGRLPVDPRTIPDVPGSAYIMSGLAPKAMLARTMWESDYYDCVRDEHNNSIGYPAVIPQVTLGTFGPEYKRWSAMLRAGDDTWTPGQKSLAAKAAAAEPETSVDCIDAVFAALSAATAPIDMDGLEAAALKRDGTRFSVRTIRGALAELRKKGQLFTTTGPNNTNLHELTPQARAEAEGKMALALESAAARDAEGGEAA